MGNRSTIRKVNQRSIVDYIIQYNGASRADIAKGLDLSKPAVSENVAELLKKGILIESGSTDSMIGKKGTMLHFNAEYAYIMVIDLTGHLYNNAVSVSVCNLNCEEKYTFVVPFKTENISALIAQTRENLEAFDIDYDKIALIVASVSGIINTKEHNRARQKQIRPYCIQEELEQGFQKPIFLFNDVNLAALGEYYLANQEKKNMAYLWIDLGIGGSFILNGELYEGGIGAAGEIGSMQAPVLHNGAIKYVKMDDVLCINAINKMLQNEVGKSTFLSTRLVETGTVTYEDLIEGKNQRDSFCVAFCENIIAMMVRLVQNIVVLLDLEYVVLGGHINLLGDDIYQKIMDEVDVGFKKSTITVNPPLSVNSSLIGGYYYGVNKVMDFLFA